MSPSLVAATEHEVKKYGGFLEQCYEEADGAEAKSQCIGAMSQVCMDDQDGGHTTLGMSSACASVPAAIMPRIKTIFFIISLAS